MTKVAHLLKDHINVLGFSNAEIAKSIGISEQYVGRIILGNVPLPLSRVKRISKVLKIDLQHIGGALIEDYTTKILKFLK